MSTLEAEFARGVAAGKAQRWQEAAHCFMEVVRGEPAHRVALQALLECAYALVRAGKVAPADRSASATASGMTSFVVCSIDAAKLARLRADVAQKFAHVAWELIHIGDARSLCEGYNRGLARAKGELVVFCHDDIGLLCADFSVRLHGHLAHQDLVGVAGTTHLTGPAWRWAGPPHTASWVSAPRGNGVVCGLLGTHGPLIAGAQALDGVLLAGRREIFEKIPFDADTFDGFHFYDIDLSYRAHRAGVRCAIALDLLLWHASGGDFGASWQHYAERFIAKFPHLAPTTAAAPYGPGAIEIADAHLANALYAWIAHWTSAPT